MVVVLKMGGNINNRSKRVPVIRVSFADETGAARELQFERGFRIGRTDDCEVCIRHEYVSRGHAEVKLENGAWTVTDLNSSNGTFVDGRRVTAVAAGSGISIQLGIKGPVVTLRPEVRTEAEPDPEQKIQQYVDRYFGERPAGAPVGEHTMYVRQAFSHVQKKQRKKYHWILAAVALIAIAAGGVAYREHQQAAKQRGLAKDLFYNMKALDVDIANFEKLVLDSGSAEGKDRIQQYQARRRQMEASYDRFLSSLHIYDPKMTQEDRLILRIARVFGECELDMPPAFKDEVKNYIKKWQQSGRLARGIKTAHENGYTTFISQQFLSLNLPPQFFYLALQESDFDAFISGPPTRMGIAKGMWQFIPDTGMKYGLRIGPLVDLRRPDVADDRHNWQLATKAAASYIKDLFSTDAQASGLLVMACYNWGEDRVIPLVRSMPANPRERNFFRLLTQYRDKLPEETYNYVFYIASAAVIGEDPRLFGFDFDNPLAHLEAK
jgi:hypothetical protein